MNKPKERYEDLLPGDDELLYRSKAWSQLFEKYDNDQEDDAISFDKVGDEENADDEEESIPPYEFEDNGVEDDPNFDLEDVLNNTMKVVAKRKENWHRTGADKLMNSFFVDRYTDKVDDWLQKNTDYFSQAVKRRERCCHDVESCIDELQIKDHRVYVENESEDDSLQSVDTAKYILSNRKKQRTRVRTMTIKRYCFSRRRMEELERENPHKRSVSPCGHSNRDKFTEHHGRLRSHNKFGYACSESHLKKQPCQYRSEHPVNNVRKCRSELKRKLKKRVRQNSPSSSSASSFLSDSKYECHPRVPHNVRLRKRSKAKPLLESVDSSEPYSLDTSDILKEDFGKSKKYHIDSDSSKSKHNFESLISESRFCPDNVVNSTTLSGKQPTSDNNHDKLPAIQEHITISSDDFCPDKLSDSVKACSEGSRKVSRTLSPIVIYAPGNISVNSKKSVVEGKVAITSQILEETIGSDLAKIYLGEQNDFSLSVDSQSKVLFYPPEQNIENSDSEADVLETMSSNTRGRIIVQLVNSQ